MKFELKTLEEYSDDALIAELRRVAQSMNGDRLTIERFNSLARVHSTTLRYRFGSWQAALDKAGISEEIAPRFRVITREQIIQALRDFAAENPGMSVTRNCIADRLGIDANNLTRRFGKWEALLAEVNIAPVKKRYTEEECFENIFSLWMHYGRQPKFGELKCPPSVVGSKAYITRWGGWRAALSAFVKKVNQKSELEVKPEKPSPLSEPSSSSLSNAEPVSRSISLALRYKILVRDNFRCVICGASPAKDGSVELHIDHIFPWSRGGQNTEKNLRTLCFQCNLGKGDKVEPT